MVGGKQPLEVTYYTSLGETKSLISLSANALKQSNTFHRINMMKIPDPCYRGRLLWHAKNAYSHFLFPVHSGSGRV